MIALVVAEDIDIEGGKGVTEEIVDPGGVSWTRNRRG